VGVGVFPLLSDFDQADGGSGDGYPEDVPVL
jgi:hypothetical protein